MEKILFICLASRKRNKYSTFDHLLTIENVLYLLKRIKYVEIIEAIETSKNHAMHTKTVSELVQTAHCRSRPLCSTLIPPAKNARNDRIRRKGGRSDQSEILFFCAGGLPLRAQATIQFIQIQCQCSLYIRRPHGLLYKNNSTAIAWCVCRSQAMRPLCANLPSIR